MKNSKKDTDRISEFRAALETSSGFILSHHTRENYNRCYTFKLLGKDLRLCARCCGIYPGLMVGFLLSSLIGTLSATLILLSGVPTLIEKYLTGVRENKGSNFVRTLTGLFLGIGFVNGFIKLASNPLNIKILSFGVFYGFSAILLIYLENPSILED